MDDLNWDGSDVLEESARILWNTQQQQGFEGCYNITNSLTHQIQEMHKVEIDHSAYSNSDRVMMVNKNLLEHATSMTVKSKAGSSWEEPLIHQSDQSLLVNRHYNMPDFNLAHHHHQQQQQQLKFNNSFDCLLSDTNSNTDTSVEIDDDGGISKLFSDTRNLWSFNYVSPTSSSGETDSNVSSYEARTQRQISDKFSIRSVGSNGTSYETLGQTRAPDTHSIRSDGSNGISYKAHTQIQTPDTSLIRHVGNKDMQCALNVELDETMSQNSSDQYIKRKAIQSSTIHNSSSLEGGFSLITDKPPKTKKPRSDKEPYSTNINFQQPNPSSSSSICCSSSTEEPDREAIAQMKELMYRAAAFRQVNFGIDDINVISKKPKRKNIKISNDPQTVAARQRREKISERIRVLQKIVPGGNKMDTASMLDEAANYLKFLRSQIKALESFGNKVNAMDCNNNPTSIAFSFNPSFSMQMVPSSYNHHSHDDHL